MSKRLFRLATWRAHRRAKPNTGGRSAFRHVVLLFSERVSETA